MALPGGKREPDDQNLKATVTSETFEETGMNLANSHFLGTLSAVQSVPRRDLLILPFVILLEHDPQVKLNCELDAFMWVPYEKLVRTKGKTEEPEFGKVSAYLLGNAVVWGITYRILRNFEKTVDDLKKQ
jgi:ADP-ribose pyrophosphatase YjhB (NUDIX family)